VRSAEKKVIKQFKARSMKDCNSFHNLCAQRRKKNNKSNKTIKSKKYERLPQFAFDAKQPCCSNIQDIVTQN
jgi:hypothetical protein